MKVRAGLLWKMFCSSVNRNSCRYQNLCSLVSPTFPLMCCSCVYEQKEKEEEEKKREEAQLMEFVWVRQNLRKIHSAIQTKSVKF